MLRHLYAACTPHKNAATPLLFPLPPPFSQAKRVVILVMDSYLGETAIEVSVFGTVLQRR